MYIDKLGFDPDTVPTLSFGELLKRIGPGIILTGVVIGPGAITTASMLGANYGYQMLWLFIPIFIMGITFMLSEMYPLYWTPSKEGTFCVIRLNLS